MSAWRASGRVSTIVASTIALDEMWTYLGVRKEEKRNDLWVWTAAVEERAAGTSPLSCGCWSVCRMRSVTRQTYMECMGRCRSTNIGWEVRRGELERGIAFDAAREVEQAGSSDKGLRKEREYAGESACAGILRQTQTQYHSPLRIPVKSRMFTFI